MLEQQPLHFEFRANQTFDDFFAGSNADIISHLQNSITGKGEQQLFIYGESGLGKTHLLQACCQKAHALHLSSFYLDLKNPLLPNAEMLLGLEALEVVCLDNVDAIAGNKDWEMALFHFFNQHRDNGHILIMSALCLPNDIPVKLPDLKTRLNWGLTLKIKPLSDDELIHAMMVKANRMGFDIPEKASSYLLNHYDHDLDALWEILAKLDKASLAAKRKVTIPFIKEVLPEL